MNLVTPKAAAKRKLLFYEPDTGQFRQLSAPSINVNICLWGLIVYENERGLQLFLQGVEATLVNLYGDG
jgi:hypothetical protein